MSRITEEALSKTIFPIADLEKSEVRELAEKYHLYTATKKDSTGVCFIGERNFDKFLDQFLKTNPGLILTVDGKKIGEHTGLIHYTIGQRKGIGIGGVGSGEPWFVAGKDLKKNILYVAQGEQHPSLYTTELLGEDVLWITEKPQFPFRGTAKFRYRQKDIPVTVYEHQDEGVRVVYDEPVRSITPGQFAVFYDGEICLGSAIITKGKPLNMKYEYLHDVVK